MRRTLLAGAVLTVAAVLAVAVSAALGLELESVALLGVSVGAVVALVPDRSPVGRAVGFGGGLVVAWVGYAVRAGFMPDTDTGRAVAVGVVVALCVAVSAATGERAPLWTVLLGAAAFAGAYELVYAGAPQELPSTSVSTATSLLLAVAVGFLAAAAFAPADGSGQRGTTEPHHEKEDPAGNQPAARLDEMMMEKVQ